VVARRGAVATRAITLPADPAGPVAAHTPGPGTALLPRPAGPLLAVRVAPRPPGPLAARRPAALEPVLALDPPALAGRTTGPAPAGPRYAPTTPVVGTAPPPPVVIGPVAAGTVRAAAPPSGRLPAGVPAAPRSAKPSPTALAPAALAPAALASATSRAVTAGPTAA
jgi:hypothetical protein